MSPSLFGAKRRQIDPKPSDLPKRTRNRSKDVVRAEKVDQPKEILST